MQVKLDLAALFRDPCTNDIVVRLLLVADENFVGAVVISGLLCNEQNVITTYATLEVA